MRKRILLCRHGQVADKAEKKYLGITDTPLDETGMSQAYCLRERCRQFSFEQIYTSPLGRCVKTAEVIAKTQTSAIHIVEELREINLGIWENCTFQEIRERYPREYALRGQDFYGYQIPQGESFRELGQRVLPVFSEIMSRNTATAVVVAHAGVNRIILCHLMKIPYQRLFEIEQPYGCMNEIIYDESNTLQKYALHSDEKPDLENASSDQ